MHQITKEMVNVSKGTHNPSAVVILAAGASSRMGQAKQNLMWGKQTLLQHSIENALRAEVGAVFVVLGANAKKIDDSIKNYPITILHNSNWQTGMGSSIALAAETATNKGFESLLIMLCDQPKVDALFLQRLVNKFEDSHAKLVATLYVTKHRNLTKNGVPAIFDEEFFPLLRQLNNDVGARSILNDGAHELEVIIPDSTLFDIDTLDDYAKYQPT